MKRTITLLIAFALVLGLSQCKKKDVKPITNNGMQITLTAGYGGEKTVFYDNGTFKWKNGETEYIYVGCDKESGCIGTLSATGNGETELTFNGTITVNLEEGDKVYFFYLGNGEHATDATTLDFSNQTSGNVTDFHIAIGSATYAGSPNFNVTLNPEMAIAKFDLSQFGSEDIYVYGDDVYASATIDYQTGTMTKETKGYINVGTGSATKYVALIPSTESQTTVKFVSNSHEGSQVFNHGIQKAKFYAVGGNNGAVVIPATLMTGATRGLFTTEKSGNIITKMVRFSQGNLQYVGSNGTWQFAEHQYDYLGTTTSQNSTNTKVTRDLFGWGTSGVSGYSPIATSYLPWSTSTNDAEYNPYGSTSTNLYDGGNNAGKADWGYNAISNGGNTAGMWRTLTRNEWVYVFNTRSTTSGVRFAKAKVNDVNGVIILPDDWSTSYYTLTSTNTTSAAFTSNTITLSDWTTNLEAHGSVFLPAAGRRDGTSVNRVGSYGYYWSSSRGYSVTAYNVYFDSSNFARSDDSDRYYGYSVRLVSANE